MTRAKGMLAYIVEKYRTLNEEEQTQYQERLQETDAQEVRTMLNIYVECGIVIGEGTRGISGKTRYPAEVSAAQIRGIAGSRCRAN